MENFLKLRYLNKECKFFLNFIGLLFYFYILEFSFVIINYAIFSYLISGINNLARLKNAQIEVADLTKSHAYWQ